MEVPRVLRLSESLNKSKVQHMIFTLDGNTFKSFGNELSVKVLLQDGEVGKKIEEILRESEQLKKVLEAKKEMFQLPLMLGWLQPQLGGSK